MADYSKSVDFAAKDALATGNAAKVVSGTEINTEFANIETAVATKVDETGGTATGLTLSGTTTISSADINGGAIDATTIGANTAAAITGTTITGTTVKGTTSLQTPLIEFTDGDDAITIADGGGVTIGDLTATTADIDGGTVDGAVIGGTTPAAITGTTVDGTTITASTQFTGSGAGLTSIPAGELTGDLPAIDGSALTNTLENMEYDDIGGIALVIAFNTTSDIAVGSVVNGSDLKVAKMGSSITASGYTFVALPDGSALSGTWRALCSGDYANLSTDRFPMFLAVRIT